MERDQQIILQTAAGMECPSWVQIAHAAYGQRCGGEADGEHLHRTVKELHALRRQGLIERLGSGRYALTQAGLDALQPEPQLERMAS